MAVVKPFPCVRPDKRYAARVAALPYDVYNRKEAKEVTAANPKSFLNIDRPESQFPDDMDMYDDRVYDKAKEMLESWIADGTFVQDPLAAYYIYELTMDGIPVKRRNWTESGTWILPTRRPARSSWRTVPTR